MAKSKPEMFQALHPDPEKKGMRVTKETFNTYKEAILQVVPTDEEGIELWAIPEAIEPHIPAQLLTETSAMWWTMTVKLDLEARGVIERVPVKKGKQRVRKVLAKS